MESNIVLLTALMRGEISAVKTYTNMLKRLNSSEFRFEFQQLLAAHANRARQLRRRLRTFCSGGSGSNKKKGAAFDFQPGVSGIDNDYIALSLLSEGEQEALRAYQTAAGQLDEVSKQLVVDELLPDQESTASVVYTLRNGLMPLMKSA